MKIVVHQLESPFCYDILNYLLTHPKAQDTWEGIVGWWVLEQRIVDADVQVKKALEELTAREFVNTREGKDGRILYRLNSLKKSQISAMLEKK